MQNIEINFFLLEYIGNNYFKLIQTVFNLSKNWKTTQLPNYFSINDYII
jgi:hypothetical protein